MKIQQIAKTENTIRNYNDLHNTSFKQIYVKPSGKIKNPKFDRELTLFAAKVWSIILLSFTTLVGLTKILVDSENKKELKNTIHTRATDIESEEGSKVTEKELLTIDEALKLYDETDRFNTSETRAWLEYFTRLDSDAGIEITEVEKNAFKNAMENKLEIKKEIKDVNKEQETEEDSTIEDAIKMHAIHRALTYPSLTY